MAPAGGSAGPSSSRRRPRHRSRPEPRRKRARAQGDGSPGGVPAPASSSSTARPCAGAVAHLPWTSTPGSPRRNSFEVSLVKEDGSTVELWSGIGKGPPRKLKFPQPEAVVEALKSSLA
ncbi:unnamed protein product [Bubo scandiacus]